MIVALAFVAVLMIGRLDASLDPNAARIVPLYRLVHKSNGEHFYTTNLKELTDAVLLHNYAQEYQCAKVSTNESSCQLKPVYRLYKKEHFYTTSDAEAAAAVKVEGYTKEGIAFYCAANLNECGATKPFYRYLIGGFDHFYTGDINEGNGVIQRGGKYEGILCYTWA